MAYFKFIDTWKRLPISQRKGFLRYVKGFYPRYDFPNELLVAILNTSEGQLHALTEESINASLNMQKPSKTIRNTFSTLNGWLLEYLAISMVRNREKDKFDLLKMEAALFHGLREEFEKMERQMKEALEYNPYKSLEHYQNEWQFHLLRLSSPWADRENPEWPEILLKMDDSTTLLLQNINYKKAMLINNFKRLYPAHELRIVAPDVLSHEAAAKSLYDEHGQIFPYVHILQQKIILQHDNDAAHRLKKIYKNYKDIPLFEQEDILNILINYEIACYFKKPVNKHAKNIYKLIDEGIISGAFLFRGYLSDTFFINAIRTRRKVGKKKKARQWLRQHKHLLVPEKQELADMVDMLNEFDDGNYQAVMDFVRTHKFSSDAYDRSCRVMELKSAYYLNFQTKSIQIKADELQRRAKTVYMFSEEQRTATINFSRAMRKLAYRTHGKQAMLDFMKDDLHVIEKEWILEEAAKVGT